MSIYRMSQYFALVVMGAVFGFLSGLETCKPMFAKSRQEAEAEVYREAYIRGHGEFIVSPSTGRIVFEWRGTP